MDKKINEKLLLKEKLSIKEKVSITTYMFLTQEGAAVSVI